jgi:GNAT superfamily N-acetyltransferase
VVTAVSAERGRAEADDWLGSCFEVVELHVLPTHQGRGLGRRILEQLLDEAEQRTAALSALEPDGSPARRLYTAQGFIPLLQQFRFPGGPTRYAVLAKRLDG